MTSCAILIPARYNSSRYVGKPLVELDGVPMIRRVYDVCKATGLDTYVLTDDMRIFDLFGPRNCWIDTAKSYRNGTERCAAAANDPNFREHLGDYDYYINVQGDMPDVTVGMINLIRQVHDITNNGPVTLFTDMAPELQDDPNTVKLVGDNGGRALWFGRGMTGYGLHHLGIYGYTKKELEKYLDLDYTNEEDVEQLEQLRWLRNGFTINLGKVEFDGVEINTPEDVERWNNAKNSMANMG